MTELLKTLCTVDGVSGHEDAVREVIRAHLERLPYCERITVDALGNLVVRLKGLKQSNKTLLYSAHMDEVGIIACTATEDGFIRAVSVGGIDKAALFGHRVRFGERVGVIGGKAVHLCKEEEGESVPDENWMVDIGASSKEEAEQAVPPGQTGTFDSEFSAMGHLVRGKAIDDRAGCALLLTLADTQPPVDLTLAFTVQEEVGLRGAKTAAFSVAPDIAVAVEATTAADTVGVPQERNVCTVGGGAVVSFMDRRTLYDRSLYAFILKTAAQYEIKAQPKTAVSGGNDASSLQTTGMGARVAALSLPCRYLHSSSCVLSMDDMEQTLRLLSVLIEPLAMGKMP